MGQNTKIDHAKVSDKIEKNTERGELCEQRSLKFWKLHALPLSTDKFLKVWCLVATSPRRIISLKRHPPKWLAFSCFWVEKNENIRAIYRSKVLRRRHVHDFC
jgi:hypothetical protein